MTTFELEAIGGPWAKRLASRRAIVDELSWNDLTEQVGAADAERARVVWTQSAFSEYASAAAFAKIASALLEAGAPIDLVAASGDFVADEMIHAELSARVANALGGAVPLEVDLTKLVRPPASDTPLMRAAELVVRTSCVGEALTVPVLKIARKTADSELIEAVIARITRDESAHAELGAWFLDWAAPRLDDAARALLGRVAGAAIESLAPLMQIECNAAPSLGVLDCDAFDATLLDAITHRVIRPLAARGIVVPTSSGRADPGHALS